MRVSSAIGTTLGIAILAAALVTNDASGRQTAASARQQLIGTWTFVSTIRPDGGSAWDPNAKGLLVFTDKGYFSIQVMRGDRPKFASNSRMKGTPEENSAAIRGILNYFGKFEVDEAGQVLLFHIESSSFPNWNGTVQKRKFTVTKDDLKYDGPPTTRGGPPSEVVWKRVH